jgi:hypothetical protein
MVMLICPASGNEEEFWILCDQPDLLKTVIGRIPPIDIIRY